MNENRAAMHANVRTTSTTDATRAANVTTASSVTSVAGTAKSGLAADEMTRESGKPEEGQSMTMSMKGNGMRGGDKDGELRRTGRHGRTRLASLLGVAGRIAESEQVAGLDHPAQFRKPGKIWMKLVGVLTAAALGLTYAGSALADDFTAPDTSSSTDSSVSSSDTWAGQADGTLDTAPSDASGNTGTNDGSASEDASNTQADTTTQPAVTPVTGCDNVQDWDSLKVCMRQSGPVTITKTIEAGGSIAIPANVEVTLTAAADLDSAINAATAGDGMFIVNGTLTIGSNAKDTNFTYKNGKRWLALVNAGGKLTVNNGVFSGVNTTGTGYANGGVISSNGDVVINGGTFANNKANTAAVIYTDSGTITINGGTFNGNSAVNAGVLYQNNNAKTVINGGAFEENSSTSTGNGGWQGGGVLRNMGGELTITGGTFSGNTAARLGGVVFNGATLKISGGTFSNNSAYGEGGGAIAQAGGTTTVIPSSNGSVMFTGNAHDVLGADGKSAVCNTTKGDVDDCKTKYGNAGGGAIFASAGKLSVQGKVTFDGNYSRIWGYMVGGGAIFMKGELWIQNDSKGNKPLFKNNYAGVAQREVNEKGTVKTALRGGAGGAIFLQEGTVDENQLDEAKKYTSKAYIMGGEFADNTSGYLGGAIYTEAHSLTYVAKAVATGNTAGHFGGGLWLCPSGTGEASKGGNIALFDNKVDKSIDPNNDTNGSPYPNDQPFEDKGLTQWDTHVDDQGKVHTDQLLQETIHGDGTEAGDDFAIMNPMWKGEIQSTNFMLMDTWFTDRTQSAVAWYKDGTPVKGASGFQDYFQDPEIQSKGGWHSGDDGGGTNIAVTKTEGRFTGATDTKIAMDADHTHKIQLTRTMDETKGVITGVALKAQKADGMTDAQWDAAKQAALNGASVVLTGNAARLSGGAFATNGDVKFSTPYTASWSKVDSEDTSKELSGSQWDLSATTSGSFTGTGTTEGEAIKSAIKQFNEKNESAPVAGPFNVDFSPTLCPVTTDSEGKKSYEEGYADGHCWKQTFGGYGATETEESNVWTVTFTSITLSAVITDNSSNDKGGTAYTGAFDNNPDGGGFDLNNLALGTYTLKERVAPTGYEMNVHEYQFKIKNGPAKWQKLDMDGEPEGEFTETDAAIPDKALPGVSWSKTDVDTGALLSDSEWTVTKYQQDGEILETKSRWIVQDCVHLTDKDINCSTQAKNSGEYLGDHDNAAGKFNITGLQPGKYRLTESVAPEGYWDPQGDVYEFTVKDADTPVQLTKVGDTAETVTAITNKLPQISWKKVDETSLDIITDSETKTEWTVTGPVAVLVDGDASTDTPELDLQSETVSVTDCQSKDDADASVRCSTQKTGKQKGELGGYYNDLDNAAGQLKISGLMRPTANQAAKSIRYQYVLKETKAPNGYMKSDKEYVFTIGATEDQSNLKLGNTECSTTVGGTNCIPNAKSVASLPLTGGDARSWMFIGTGLALMAALAALATGWVKRRELW
ncbi:SpaA isopeptide-forming pilin-related protein [Bifidobacterium myosotis]|uniref:SpaA-like prealbumin fold domain-containing protein n=1 Tax=Bifidobacterium myosotis TaxID=1630166 RepID=A0A5M9ZLG2_9BIFI|nr:SpaA isopeptide-forming pilin-related protein [Bifidobacterium myosotis]KAA8828476.1 hypothetical protein EMO91_04820 [Bifidobacterium myosotis]